MYHENNSKSAKSEASGTTTSHLGKTNMHAYRFRRKHPSDFTGATTKHVWHNKIQQ